MTVWYAQNSTVNIDSVNEWNDAANGSGNWLTWANLAAGDVLSANGKTSIAINVDVTCFRLSTMAESGGAAGGGFSVTAARTLNCYLQGGTTPCVTATGTGYTLTIVQPAGASYALIGGGSANAMGLQANAALTLAITGNATGGSADSAYGLFTNNGSTVVNLTGDVTGGAGLGRYGLYSGGGASFNITGSVTGNLCPAISNAGTTTVTSGNIINGTKSAITGTGAVIFNPGAGNYIKYKKTTGGAGDYYYGKSIPAASVISGVNGDGASAPAAGTYVETSAADVKSGVTFGPASAYTGTYEAAGGGGGGPLIGLGGLVA